MFRVADFMVRGYAESFIVLLRRAMSTLVNMSVVGFPLIIGCIIGFYILQTDRRDSLDIFILALGVAVLANLAWFLILINAIPCYRRISKDFNARLTEAQTAAKAESGFIEVPKEGVKYVTQREETQIPI